MNTGSERHTGEKRGRSIGRQILVGSAALCLVFGIFTSTLVIRMEPRRRALAKLNESGGSVRLEFGFSGRLLSVPELARRFLGDELFRRYLAHFCDAHSAEFY